MAQLRQDYKEFIARDAEIVAVAPDNARVLKDFWHEEQIPFIGLPDTDHKVADLYQQEVNPLKLGRMPALFVIDKKGAILFKHYSTSMSDIVTDNKLFKVLDMNGKQG
jgi:peroxiredoxin